MVLTALAVSLPCAAWFVAGSRAARQEAARLASEPIALAERQAATRAYQLARRLELVEQVESARPYLDYQDLDGTYQSDCIYDTQFSPMTGQSIDPLIWTHFQMDEVGELSMPALGGTRDPADTSASSIRAAMYEELECASSNRLAALRPINAPAKERLVQSSDGTTTIGPFEWYTISISEQAALVAMRRVTTASAVLTQGFVVLAEALNGLLAEEPLPATVFPGEPADDGEAAWTLDGEVWTVRIDLTEALRDARVAGREVQRDFWLRFLGGAVAAALAGAMLVGLVFQSDRLALRRAQFAASAAHELRTPLAGLRLYGEMLAEGLGNPDHREKYARRIADEADRLGRVVSNVLGYSRLERGGLTVRPQRGDLAATVRESVARLAPAIEHKGARIDLTLDAPLAPALHDADAVHQILQNLIDNAEKYTRNAEDRRIEVRLDAAEQGPRLSVIDHGAGVPPSLRGVLFEPFTRVENSESPAGLGIGLSLVKALATEQQATVSHEDAAGGGSCFTVQFAT